MQDTKVPANADPKVPTKADVKVSAKADAKAAAKAERVRIYTAISPYPSPPPQRGLIVPDPSQHCIQGTLALDQPLGS